MPEPRTPRWGDEVPQGATELQPAEGPEKGSAQEGNGTAQGGAGRPPGEAPGGIDPETLRRAEEMVDRMGEQIGHYATVLGREFLKWAARAREEAEDIWAEAQQIRRGGPP